MITGFKIQNNIKRFIALLFCLFVLLFQNSFQIMNAQTMENDQNGSITEELRLKVPYKFNEVWLKAEKQVWDPWLAIQEGFLGRQIFLDKEREEALILILWESKKSWKSIPMSEVNQVQKKFEDNVKTALNVDENPFELIYEGELDKQG